jgi:chloramphenicol 3-O-phosphotransferase
MSAELVHLSCWALLASMVVFLIVGGMRTYREFVEAMSQWRASRKPSFRRGWSRRPSETTLRFA